MTFCVNVHFLHSAVSMKERNLLYNMDTFLVLYLCLFDHFLTHLRSIKSSCTEGIFAENRHYTLDKMDTSTYERA